VNKDRKNAKKYCKPYAAHFLELVISFKVLDTYGRNGETADLEAWKKFCNQE
jgi:hypothetical protein